MPIVLALIGISLGWLLIKGKIKPAQLPPILLGLVAFIFFGRGERIGGILGLGIAAAWFQGLTMRWSHKGKGHDEPKAIKNARILLGASPLDDADTIRAQHRILIADSHPDTGGNNRRAAELNEARDLLLTKLSNPNG
jgi:DnaJ homolog subfamily C member 19